MLIVWENVVPIVEKVWMDAEVDGFVVTGVCSMVCYISENQEVEFLPKLGLVINLKAHPYGLLSLARSHS